MNIYIYVNTYVHNMMASYPTSRTKIFCTPLEPPIRRAMTKYRFWAVRANSQKYCPTLEGSSHRIMMSPDLVKPGGEKEETGITLRLPSCPSERHMMIFQAL